MTSTLHKRNLSLSALLMIAISHSCLIEGWGQARADQDRLAEAIDRLCSSSEQERQIAKEQITHFGTRAIRPLISRLEELTRYSHRSIPDGDVGGETELNLPSGSKEKRCYTNPKTNWEVSSAVCELLGRLRAVEAIPPLLKIMENEVDIGGNITAMTFEMQSLVAIGEPAVSQIIGFFESAESRAESIKFGAPQPSREVQTRHRQAQAAIMRARAAAILGEIGDVRALPVLEESLRLSPAGAWRPDLQFIREAITKIKGKN
jgi:PBS lyase HEAT-like repeat